MTYDTNIYSFITTQEANFELPIAVAENFEFNFYQHVLTTVLYKNSTYLTGKDENKPFKNIIRPILNLAYRAEGFDVKDIVLFINDSYQYFKSFLVKKYHEKWARENKIDTFIDELVESYVDFGGALVKNINQTRPEVVPLQRLAFCDQTDILSGPIAERHHYSPNELRNEAKKGWKNIEEVITLAQDSKVVVKSSGQTAKTPGKYIEVYEVHGTFPAFWLDESENDEFIPQLHICTFYQLEDGTKKGITLWSGKEKELPYKLVLRDKIYGRALGSGGAEELFEPLVWTNYGVIRIKEMLDQATKVLYKTTDAAFANRNKTQELEQGEILVLDEGKDIGQLDTQPRNVVIFENSIKEWEQHARQMGAATESILGESPSAGTPFKLQELVTAESHSLHEYRKGKLAIFVDEIYRDWIIPHIVKEITKGQKFLAELELDELQSIADALVICETNKALKERILNGETIYPDEIEAFKQKVRDEFMRGGNKKFMEILKGEMKDAPIDVEINIVGKQKDLAGKTDKLVNVMRFMFSIYNPQTQEFAVFQDPRMIKLFNQIIESSGLSPIDFYAPPKQPQPVQPVPVEATKPLAQLAERPTVAQQIR